MAKKACPITREYFEEHAGTLRVQIEDTVIDVPIHEFKSDSLGWYLNTKITVLIGGVKVPVQVGANFTLIGSKELD